MCICQWKKKDAGAELEVSVFVDVQPERMRTLCLGTLHWGGRSEADIARNDGVSHCLEDAERRREGEVGERDR